MKEIPSLAVIVAALLLLGCGHHSVSPRRPDPAVFPASDPNNRGGWVLNASVSDEIDGNQLDEGKWLIQGKDGFYRSDFIGRAPSQFALDNVRVEDGLLKIATRWEPDYPFSDKLDGKKKLKYENITTAAINSKQTFLYGYMEIRAKAADASVSSAFWLTGNNSELDINENFGRPAQRRKVHIETEIWSSVHDWSQPAGSTSVWTDRMQLPFRVADGFHVYGCEWSEAGLKFYVDGEQLRDVKKADVKTWVLTSPMWVWIDSETFPWHGVPVEEDLPVDYEVEYVRVWQKPDGP